MTFARAKDECDKLRAETGKDYVVLRSMDPSDCSSDYDVALRPKTFYSFESVRYPTEDK